MSSSSALDMPMTSEADPASARVLWARLRRGDAEAFESVVRGNQDRVFDFCFRMVSDREEASDLTQEIFVSVLENVQKFRHDSKLSTWIFRIAKNHCLNRLKYLKRRGRGRSEAMENVGEAELINASGAPTTPDEALATARERQRVQLAIQQLPNDQRLLVALRDIEGLSYDEIQEITDLPEGTVKSRLHRARERLAELLEETQEETQP